MTAGGGASLGGALGALVPGGTGGVSGRRLVTRGQDDARGGDLERGDPPVPSGYVVPFLRADISEPTLKPDHTRHEIGDRSR